MLCHHFLSGTLLGTIFLGVGDDANRPFDNFKFVISAVVFFMYTHVMCPVLICKYTFHFRARSQSELPEGRQN